MLTHAWVMKQQINHKVVNNAPQNDVTVVIKIPQEQVHRKQSTSPLASQSRYAGSEAHLAELMDKVYDLMQNYGTTTDPKTGERGFMRINSRAGETITISNVNFSSGGTQELKAAVRH